MVDKQERLWDVKLLMCEAYYHLGQYSVAEVEVETALRWNPKDATGTIISFNPSAPVAEWM